MSTGFWTRVQFPPVPPKQKKHPSAGSHKDVYKTVGTGVLDCPQQKNFGRELVIPADLCYNGVGDEYG